MKIVKTKTFVILLFVIWFIPSVLIGAEQNTAIADSQNSSNQMMGGDTISYIIKPGDWLSSIAEKFYGDPALFDKIVEANKNIIKNPDLIYPGTKLLIPHVDVTYSYSVKSGDTISKIAKMFFGNPDKTNELIEQNQNLLGEGNHVTPGQLLKIKFKDGTVCYTVRSGDWLSKISKKFLGDALLYPWLFQKNRNLIENPNLIYPGQEIIIPPSG